MIVLLVRLAFLSGIFFLLTGCGANPSIVPPIDKKIFSDYWYQGKAEISSYDLTQSSNGIQSNGSEVMIFVAEVMSKSKQVKLDNPVANSSDAVRVMKMIINKDFITGINKYSMMSSVFTPVDYSDYTHSLKFTASSQNWDGQTFTQYNLKGNRYDIQQFSYFESEGDQSFSLLIAWLEDEIWTKIRVAPNTLPIGKITMIPSAFYLHLSHQKDKIYDAVTSLKPENDEYTYTIEYPELIRTLVINFQPVFPYKITGWKETYANKEVTSGRLSASIMSDFWNHNHPGDEVLRQELNLNK